MVNQALVEQINEPPQVCHAGQPLIFAVREDDVQDAPVQRRHLLEVPQLAPDQVALVHGVAHLAPAAGLAPVLLDLPDQLWIGERGHGTVQVAGGDMQSVLHAPDAPRRGLGNEADAVTGTDALRDGAHGGDQGVGRLVMVRAARCGAPRRQTGGLAKGQRLRFRAQERPRRLEILLAHRQIVQKKAGFIRSFGDRERAPFLSGRLADFSPTPTGAALVPLADRNCPDRTSSAS